MLSFEAVRLETFDYMNAYGELNKDDFNVAKLARLGYSYRYDNEIPIAACVFCDHVLDLPLTTEDIGILHYEHKNDCPYFACTCEVNVHINRHGKCALNIPINEKLYQTELERIDQRLVQHGVISANYEPVRRGNRHHRSSEMDFSFDFTIRGNSHAQAAELRKHLRFIDDSIGRKFCVQSILPYKVPMFARISKRKRTLENLPIYMIQNPEDLARNGFAYYNKHDALICFSCGEIFDQWQPFMDPFKRHASRTKKCQYLLTKCGEDFVYRNYRNYVRLNLGESISKQYDPKPLTGSAFDNIEDCQ
jgi:hypothetical protein